uniref:Uncharacterized protein n=1 Tax=Arundo donax TaxID=35708 RepID=A0A0A9ENY2_ARUDO
MAVLQRIPFGGRRRRQ